MQHTLHRFAHGHIQGEGRQRQRVSGHLALHFRRFAKEYRHGQIHRRIAEMAVFQRQVLLRRGLTNHRIGAALAPADILKALQLCRLNRQYVALL